AERRNLVPVDWAAGAVVRIMGRPAWHGRTFHLVAREAVPVRVIKEVAAEVLGLDGVSWGVRGTPTDLTDLEKTFLDHRRESWPYLADDPEFDCRNTRAALPDLPPPAVGPALLRRLIAFAVADGWGRRPREGHREADGCCADYVERFFPER